MERDREVSHRGLESGLVGSCDSVSFVGVGGVLLGELRAL